MIPPRRIELSSFLKAEPRFGSVGLFFRELVDHGVAGGGDGAGPLLLVADREGGAHLLLAGDFTRS